MSVERKIEIGFTGGRKKWATFSAKRASNIPVCSMLNGQIDRYFHRLRIVLFTVFIDVTCGAIVIDYSFVCL